MFRKSFQALGPLLFLNTVLGAQSFTDSNLPIVVISSGSQNIDSAYSKQIVSAGIVDNGPGNRNHLSDPFNDYNGKIEIKVHGSSSSWLAKKSWTVTTVDASDNKLDVPLLGMPKDHDWVFKALYQDKTFLRDELTYKLFREMGHYCSRLRFFELVVNGSYRGVYELVEKVKRGKNRVNIAKLKPNEIAGDSLTGGYIISLDHYKPTAAGWNSNYMSNATNDSACFFLYIYPKPDSIAPQQKNYIKGFFDKYELVLNSSYWNDPDSGYIKYINDTSFIDAFILNELARNTDSYRLSTYLYKDKDSRGDGRIHCGPEWDFDIGWYNCAYSGGDNPNGWQYLQDYHSNFIPFWWKKLLTGNAFKQKLRCRYEFLRSNILDQGYLYAHIDSFALYLDESQARNFQRWTIMGQVIYPGISPAATSYAGEVSELKNWIAQRLTWLDVNMPGNCAQGTENILAGNSLRAWPNPFNDNIQIQYELQGNTYIRMELVNAIGSETRVICCGSEPAGSHRRDIDTRDLRAGIYFLKVTTDAAQFTGKLLKVN